MDETAVTAGEQQGEVAESTDAPAVRQRFAACHDAEIGIIAEKMRLRNPELQPLWEVTEPEPDRPLTHGHFNEGNLFAVALSGGGIRSASFALGVLQALEWRKVLREMHYLSTVSGGGYVGCALTWQSHRHTQLIKKGKKSGKAWHFAFGRQCEGSRNRADPASAAEAPPGAAESECYQLIDLVRHRCDYLRPGRSLGLASLLSLGLLNSLIALGVYFAVLMLFVSVFAGIQHMFGVPHDASKLGLITLSKVQAIIIGLVMGMVAVYALAGSVTLRRRPVKDETWPNVRYRWRHATALVASKISFGLLIFIALDTLPFAASKLFADSPSWAIEWTNWLIIAAGLGAVITFSTVRAGVAEATRSLAAAPRQVRLPTVLAAFAMIYLSSVLCYKAIDWSAFDLLTLVTLLAACILALISGAFINPNYVGLYRYYRDRLCETFLPDDATVKDGCGRLALEADIKLLKDIGGKEDAGLYHLINANLVIGDHPCAPFAQRGCDSFVFSHAYYGSQATGWYPTSTLSRDATLGTALAISGAAVNPGVGGDGTLSRSWLVKAVMRFLNLRLGYWLENPMHPRTRSGANWHWPHFIIPGLWDGVIGPMKIEKAGFLELTDGGHFDNTGVYELIRRKVKLIILSDVGADPEYRFDDISNLIERIRVDFGTRIEFLDDRGLDDVVPRSGGDDAFLTRLGFARRGHAVARIYYNRTTDIDRDETGLLIIVKPTIVAGLPHDIYNYRANHDSFPAQSTANQFFTEKQMEAYRELGFELTSRMIDDAEITDWFPYLKSRRPSATAPAAPGGAA